MEGNHHETSSLDAWELSKENVLPLKQGRKITNLTAALQPQNVDRQQQLILQRQGFETELRAYAGDDPLDPWVRYIQWTEQNFPQGGKDSHLGTLMQKCLIQFKHDDKYKQDPRYAAIWLKMAQSESESLEIYKFMQANQIGTQLTIFYEAWAWELEQLGNTKKADMIYKEGLSLNAQPRDRLERSLIEFQSRVGRATMHQLQEGMMNPSAVEDQRIKLGDLRAKGKHQKVGPNRTGAATLSSRGGLGVAPAPLQQRVNRISVFCDDDAKAAGGLPSSKPATSSEWQHLPSRSEAQKENTQAAGQWKGQRLPQRNMPGMTFQEVGSFSKPSFDVHVDENAEQITTPHKPVEMGHQVLSERKPSKPANVLQQFQKESSNDNSRVMYCKHLIYGGAREMSFEELRAIKHSNKRKERELQAKEAAIREREEMLLRKQEEQQDMFVKFQEELQQQRMMHQQLITMLMKQKQEPGAQPDSSTSSQLQQALHPSQVLGNQPPTSQPPPQIPPTSMQQLAPPTQHQLQPQPPSQALTLPVQQQQQQQQHVLPSQEPPIAALPPSCDPEQDVPMETGQGIPGGPFEQQQKVPCANQSAPEQPMDTMANNHVRKDRTRSNSGDSTFACTQQLVFDDLTASAVSGGFNIFCDREQTQAPRNATVQSAGNFGPVSQPATVTANTLSGTQSLSMVSAAPSATIQTEAIHCRPDTVTPNQSLYLNTSGDPTSTAAGHKTPSANLSASSSNKTPSSASAPAAEGTGAHCLFNRLSSIRTPKGLTAPSPTINTKEALGVINAMLNSSLESNMFGLGDLSIKDVPSQDKEFEMEFANTETTEEDNKQLKKGFIFEDNSSAFTQVGGFAGHGIIPRRQPLAVRPSVTPLQQSTLPPAPTTAHAGGRVPFGERKPPMASTTPGYPQPCTVSAAPTSFPAQPATDMDAHCSSGIPIYDENVDVRGGGENIKIFEDEPANTKENTPPSDYRQEEVKREMAGILQSSKSIPFEPLEEDAPATVSAMATDAGNASHQFTAPPADPLTSSQHMNATLAPSAGNHSFEVAARMASTPFNDVSHCQLSFMPPMSTIKPREVEQTLLGASLGPATDNLSHQVPTATHPIQAASGVSGTGLASRVVAHPVNESFEKTEYTANHSGGPLSPIMETSNENVRSSASSSSSSSNSHASLECSHPPASATCVEEKPEPAPVPTASGFSIHVDQDEPMVSDAQPPEQLPPPAVAPHSMLGASFQHEASMIQSQHSHMEGPQDESTRRVSFLQKDDLPALECSFIPDRPMVDVSAVLEQSMMAAATDVEEPLDFKDPFNIQLQSFLLANLSKPLTMYKGFYQHEQDMPDIQPGLAVNFGDEINVYNVNKKVGEGAFATIYLAGCLDAQDITDLDYEDRKVVLKVQRPPCPWEFYIVKELHARLSRLPSQVDVRPCLMSADCAHVYADSSCLVTEYHRHGTLLDFINSVRSVSGDAMQENWVILFTIEILQIVDFMHRCNIIHGDIKPDNFLLANFVINDNVTCSHDTSNLLKLIDMGRSIDMRLFPDGTTFTAKCNTSGFNCTEMQSGRPWTYQVDYYGIAGTVHCLLFGSYMKVYQEGGQWKMTSNIHRRARANWKHFFHTLLNVPSCDPADQPSLSDLRRGLEQLVNLPLDKGRMKMNMEIMLT